MKFSFPLYAALVVIGVAGCSQSAEEPAKPAAEPAAATTEEPAMSEDSSTDMDIIEITSGLTARILQRGYGREAVPGDYVEVHYTGWLWDPEAEDNRGDKFDSSVDRGQRFGFTLGEGRVIKGWDQGVAGMLIGEKRELTIAPEMGYGDRGAGNVIPPGATLVFEVELFAAEGPGDSQ
ncbi:MAG: FKBP-type peptidyl-prolyl cis-trans isomerase [Woeseiaceae bacterium]|jgi:FKBP-type peptidyl-prolyl cis-trans isomerase FkpA